MRQSHNTVSGPAGFVITSASFNAGRGSQYIQTASAVISVRRDNIDRGFPFGCQPLNSTESSATFTCPEYDSSPKTEHRLYSFHDNLRYSHPFLTGLVTLFFPPTQSELVYLISRADHNGRGTRRRGSASHQREPGAPVLLPVARVPRRVQARSGRHAPFWILVCAHTFITSHGGKHHFEVVGWCWRGGSGLLPRTSSGRMALRSCRPVTMGMA